MFLTRPMARTYHDSDPVHVMNAQGKGYVQTGGFQSLRLPFSGEPMMPTGNGGYVPAAQDPTDRSTWRVPVIFT